MAVNRLVELMRGNTPAMAGIAGVSSIPFRAAESQLESPMGNENLGGLVGAPLGLLLGGGLGYAGGSKLEKYLLNNSANLTKTVKGAGKLATGKTKLVKSLLKNPKLLKFGGAAVGAALLSQLMSQSLGSPQANREALQYQSLMSQQAMSEQQDLQTILGSPIFHSKPRRR